MKIVKIQSTWKNTTSVCFFDDVKWQTQLEITLTWERTTDYKHFKLKTVNLVCSTAKHESSIVSKSYEQHGMRSVSSAEARRTWRMRTRFRANFAATNSGTSTGTPRTLRWAQTCWFLVSVLRTIYFLPAISKILFDVGIQKQENFWEDFKHEGGEKE